MLDDAAEEENARAEADLIRLVGERVRAARKALGMSRRALAEGSGVSLRYLAQLEGGRGNISIALLLRVARALQSPVENFVAADAAPTREIGDLIARYRGADPARRAQAMRLLDPGYVPAGKAERICLVGLRGAGKSTLGALVGQRLGLPFVELNGEIEKQAGIPIAEIIALYGQEGYRQLEAAAIDAIVASEDRVVVAAAGGVVADEETFARVLRRFHTVWIRASAEEHMERVRAQGDTRPMADNPQAMAQLRQILKSREARYSESDHSLDTTGAPLEASAQALADLLRRNVLADPAQA